MTIIPTTVWKSIEERFQTLFGRVNMKHPYIRYPKLKICILELILDSYEYIPAAYVTMHCMS
jgi:hypothetical protein